MAGEDDVELRDLVAHTLETRGVLGKIRAQLRASVFLALEEQESQQKPHPLVSSRFQEYLKTKNGQLATALVREFLSFFDLDCTCSVFDPETNALEVCPVRNELARDLGLDVASSTGPLLDSLLQRATLTSFQQPLSTASLTAAPREHQENSDTQTRATNTTLSTQTQPVAKGSLSTAPNTSTTNTTTTNDPSLSIANPTLAVTDKPDTGIGGASDFSQFSKPGSLPPLPENSLPSHDATGVGSSFKPMQEHKDALESFGQSELVSGSEGDRISDSQGQVGAIANAPMSVNAEQLSGVNGKSADVDKLNDFCSKPLLNATEQREGKDDRGSHQDGFHSDGSFSEHSDAKFAGRSSNKFEETEDMTLSQNSLTAADFDYAEPAKT